MCVCVRVCMVPFFKGGAGPKAALAARRHRSFARANTQAILPLSTGLRSHQIPVEGFRASLAGGDAWASTIPREGARQKRSPFPRELVQQDPSATTSGPQRKAVMIQYDFQSQLALIPGRAPVGHVPGAHAGLAIGEWVTRRRWGPTHCQAGVLSPFARKARARASTQTNVPVGRRDGPRRPRGGMKYLLTRQGARVISHFGPWLRPRSKTATATPSRWWEQPPWPPVAD